MIQLWSNRCQFFLPRYFIYTFWNDSIILSLFFSALCINEDVEDEPEENDISSESEQQQVEIFAQNEEEETKNNDIESEIEKKVDIEITNNEKHEGVVSKTSNEQKQQPPSELNNVGHETSDANKDQEAPITTKSNSMSIIEEENLDPVAEQKDTNDDDEWKKSRSYF